MADTPTPPQPKTVEDYAKAQADDWGQYVATQDITHNGVLAYAAGAPVPASNVALYKYDTQGVVAKVGTKAGQQAVADVLSAAGAGPVEGAVVSLATPYPPT